MGLPVLQFCFCGFLYSAIAFNGTDESNASQAHSVVVDISGNDSDVNSANGSTTSTDAGSCAEDVDKVECMNSSNSTLGYNNSTELEGSTTSTSTTTTTTMALKGPGFEFVHDGHCAGGWKSPNSQQSSLQACRDECASRADIGYFAFNGAVCACYTKSAACPDDDTHAAFNAYRILQIPAISSITTTTTETSTPASSTTITITNMTLTNVTTSSAPVSTTQSSPMMNWSQEISADVNTSLRNSSDNTFSLSNKSFEVVNGTALAKEPFGDDEVADSILTWAIVGSLLVLLVSGTALWLLSRRNRFLIQSSVPGVEGKADIERGLEPAIMLPADEPLAYEDIQDKLDKVSGSTQAVEDTDSQEIADVCSSSSIVIDIPPASMELPSQQPIKIKEDEGSPAVSMSSNVTSMEALDPFRGEDENPNEAGQSKAETAYPGNDSPVSLTVPPERFGSSPHLLHASSPEPASKPQGWSVFSFPRSWFPASCAKPTTEDIRGISRASSLMDANEPCQHQLPSDSIWFPASCAKPTAQEILSISRASSLLDAHEPCQMAAHDEKEQQSTVDHEAVLCQSSAQNAVDQNE